jgi:hypothetical protein
VHDGPGIDRGKRASNTFISFSHKHRYTHACRIAYTFGNSNGNRYREAYSDTYSHTCKRSKTFPSEHAECIIIQGGSFLPRFSKRR